jgi:predicted phage-related endonuclease
MATITPIENKEQWLGLRKQVIGASEAAALVGVHEYLTYYGLWARKSGKLPEVVDDTGPMERGRRLESVAIEVIRDRFPHLNLTVPHEHYADHTFGLGATPDLLATSSLGGIGDGVIQIKSVAPAIFRRNWFDDSDVVTPPIWIVIQALQEAYLTGSQWASVAALVIDHEIDLHLIEVPMHAGIIENIKTESLRFWEIVFSGREPDPDYKRDGELIRARLKKDDGSEVDLSAYNDMQQLLDDREQAAKLAKSMDAEKKAIDAQLLHRLGSASIGRFNGGYISAKTIHRPAYTTKPTSYRQLRVVRDKQINGGADYGADD